MKKKRISRNVYENIIIAVCVMIYCVFINFLYYKLKRENLLVTLKVLSMIILSAGIILLEISYRKELGKLAINAIEVIAIAAHALSITHVVEFQKLEFSNYILVSSFIFSLYYLTKALIVYTREKREYLKNLSDIKEIVSNEPVKKEATKRGENQ